MLRLVVPILCVVALTAACSSSEADQVAVESTQEPTAEATVATPEEPDEPAEELADDQDADDAEPTGEPDDEPTPTPTPTPTTTEEPTESPEPTEDPSPTEDADDGTEESAEPEEIDEEFAEEVFAALLAGQTEMLSEVSADGERGEVYDDYVDSLFAPEWQPTAHQVWDQYFDDEFAAFRDDLEAPEVAVTEILDATDDCVHFLAGTDPEAWYDVEVNATIDDVYPRAISRAPEDVDRDINDTGWLLLGDSVSLSTLELGEPCG